MAYETLLDVAIQEGIEVFENNYIGRVDGLYVDNTITINTRLETSIDKKCVLAEELGHHYLTHGNILDQTKSENRKEENKARRWAYDRLIGLKGIIEAYEYGVNSLYEMAEYLEVSERFLVDAIECYDGIYGTPYEFDNYLVYFKPLAIYDIYKIK